MERESCRTDEQQFPQPKASNLKFLINNFQLSKDDI